MSAIIADVDDGLGVVLVNGYVESYGVVGIAMHVLKLVRAGLHQDEIPPLPATADPRSVDNATDYAGTYSSDGKTLVIAAQGGRLLLKYGGRDVAL